MLNINLGRLIPPFVTNKLIMRIFTVSCITIWYLIEISREISYIRAIHKIEKVDILYILLITFIYILILTCIVIAYDYKF